MDASIVGLGLFWAMTLLGLATLGFALASGRLKPGQVLTRREWIIAGKIVGIVVLALLVIYFHNAGRYAGKDFIYGRF
jgi:hypothetical protein